MLRVIGFSIGKDSLSVDNKYDEEALRKKRMKLADILIEAERKGIKLADESKDCVFINNIAYDKLIRPALRILKPKGLLFITFWCEDIVDKGRIYLEVIEGCKRKIDEFAAEDASCYYQLLGSNQEVPMWQDYPSSGSGLRYYRESMLVVTKITKKELVRNVQTLVDKSFHGLDRKGVSSPAGWAADSGKRIAYSDKNLTANRYSLTASKISSSPVINPLILNEIFSYALSHYKSGRSPYIIAIGGATAIGKSTLSRELLVYALQCLRRGLTKQSALSGILLKRAFPVGLDEFKHHPRVRNILGTEWGPEHYRMPDAVKFMKKVTAGKRIIFRRQHIISPQTMLIPNIAFLSGAKFVIFEGLYVISDEERLGYLLRFADLPIYMDVAAGSDEEKLSILKKWRFEQEKQKPHPRSELEMERHWEEGNVPDTINNVFPSKENAKLIIYLDEHRNMELEWKKINSISPVGSSPLAQNEKRGASGIVLNRFGQDPRVSSSVAVAALLARALYLAFSGERLAASISFLTAIR